LAVPKKVHLIGARRHGPDTACGKYLDTEHTGRALRISSEPADVTCIGCQKTVAMADAELRRTHRPVPKRRR